MSLPATFLSLPDSLLGQCPMIKNGSGTLAPSEIARVQQMAADGDLCAQYSLGVLYAEGQEVPQDYVQALRWYRLAADKGLAEAKRPFGPLYPLPVWRGRLAGSW